jgi:hypothetical protein
LQPYGAREEFQTASHIYARSEGYASVVHLDATHLKKVLDNDPVKLLKYWNHLAYRRVFIHAGELPQISVMTVGKVKELCRMCDLKIYKNGEKVDLRDGGILIRGGL